MDTQTILYFHFVSLQVDGKEGKLSVSMVLKR